MPSIIFPVMQYGDACPIKEPGAFGPLTHREALPILGMKQERLHFADFHLSALPIRGQDSNGFIARDSQYVGIAMRFQPGAQVQVAPIDRISYHPGDRDLSLPDAFKHLLSQFTLSFGNEPFQEYPLLGTASVLYPWQGKIEFPIDEGMPSRRDIGEKHADLAVLDLPGRPTVLHLDARRLLPALGETGFVNDQDGDLDRVVPGRTRVDRHAPDRHPKPPGEQALHAIGSSFSGMLGQMPAIFALDGTQQALQVRQSTTARFWSGKTRGNARMELGE